MPPGYAWNCMAGGSPLPKGNQGLLGLLDRDGVATLCRRKRARVDSARRGRSSGHLQEAPSLHRVRLDDFRVAAVFEIAICRRFEIALCRHG